MKKSQLCKPYLKLIAMVLLLAVPAVYAGQSDVVKVFKQALKPVDDGKKIDQMSPVTTNTVLVKTPYQGGRFYTETRKDKIDRFACSKCHDKATPAPPTNAAKIAHSDVLIDHGGEKKPLACATCHDRQKRDLLVAEGGASVDMDHVYLVCGGCHFRQQKDWVGGAHGKRVQNWAGKRVVKNCTSCHDPHAPLFKKRWPATYSSPTSR
jgi:hypothetical protein